MEINNLHQWFLMLDEQAKNVEKHENTIDKFYKKLKYKQETLYTKPMLLGFYNKEKFSKRIGAITLHNILPILLISAIIILISWIILVVTKNVGIIDAFKLYGTSSFIYACIIGIITLLCLYGLTILFTYLGFNSIKKTLAKQEKNLIEIMKQIPSRYRTSDRMKLLAQIYFTKKEINIDVAFTVCDDLMYQNSTRPFEPLMYDVDFICPIISNTSEKMKVQLQQSNVNESNKQHNMYLPDDIESKTFEGSKDSDKDLEKMIGLDSVKQQIEKLKNRMKFYGNAQNNGNHMAFMGGAGTGKTTVARIITKMLYDLGYIKKNQYVEISGDYLRSGNSKSVSTIMDYAVGGVLFIDEAYLLYDKHGSGAEATGILLKAMEDRRSEFVVILAGYEEQMTKLLASNEGFSSRIKHTIYFPDYTVEEMLNIFNSFIKTYNGSSYKLHDEAVQPLLDLFALEKQSKSFGNARTVRNAVDGIMDYYADRCINSNQNTKIVELCDVELYINDRKNILQHELKNMSASNQFDESIIRLSELKSKLKNGSENPEYDLQQLIGLESFGKEMNILKSQKEFFNTTNLQRILLLGEDGCGKSTITKILTGYLYQLGYIQENKYLDISAEFLKGSYVGHTNKRAEAIISYATGGVLLIRNMNILVSSEDSFSQEAITAIINALNNNTNVTIVIADYESMYLNSIKNLFTLTYTFPKYSAEQLYKIFILQAQNDSFTLNQYTEQKLFNYINQSKLGIRDIISLYNNTKKNHISNYDGNEENKFIISEQDIYIEPSNQLTEVKKIKLNLKQS